MPAEGQHQRALRHRGGDVGRQRRGGRRRRIVDAMRDGGDRRQPPAEAGKMAGLDRRSRVDGGGRLEVGALDQRDPRGLHPPAPAPDQLGHEHAARRDDVRHAIARGRRARRPRSARDRRHADARRRSRRPLRRGRGASAATNRADAAAARKVRDLDALEIDRPPQRHVAVSRTVDAGREDMNVVAVGRQGPAKRMDRTDRAAIPDCGKIGRNDVKKAQGEAATR